VPAVLPDIPPSFPGPETAFAVPDTLGALDGPFGLNGLLGDRNPIGSAGPDAIGHLRAVTTQANTLAATAASAAPDDAGFSGSAAATSGTAAVDALGPGLPDAQDRKVLVFEPTSGGLLTLLAHSAVSDLAQLNATVRVSTATSPGQGTAMLAAEPFRCVVVDLSMRSALEFLDQVQEKPELREVPVLAHALGEPGADMRDRLGAFRYGYPSLELLPSLDDLRERITLHLSAAQPGQVPPLAGDGAARVTGPSAAADKVTTLPEHPELRDKHVLVIDDDARNVFAISSTLELHGLRVTHASDGRRGIEALRAAPDTDLILMDVMMPGMDGYATMTAVRQMPQFGRLPIIAVTARAMPGDREKSLAAGANDYVTKPVDTDELLACMERWLSMS
jgi:CheY-like chemotaxis protein